MATSMSVLDEPDWLCLCIGDVVIILLCAISARLVDGGIIIDGCD